MKQFRLKKLSILSALIGSIPSAALAQVPELPKPITSYDGIRNAITLGARWFFGIIIAISVFFILYAALTYLTAGGDDTKVTEAKNRLIYAIVAIAVAVLAAGVASIVGSFFNVPNL